MKKSWTFAAITILLTFALSVLTGCGRGDRGPLGPTTAGTKSPITFTFYNWDNVGIDGLWNDPVAREITNRTGVTLKVDFPVGGTQHQTIPLMIASGDLPDIIFAKGDLSMLIEAGYIIPLDDLIETRGHNLKILYGDLINRLRNSGEDPQIYNVGTYPVHGAVWDAAGNNGTWQIQHSVLRELGYPRMETLENYENAIRTYMRRFPTINGMPTIGFSLLIDTWQWYISLSNPSCFLLGYQDDGQWIVDQDTLEAYYKFQHPDARHYYYWLSRMHAEGILDPESFTQTEDVWRAKIASGRVLGISYPAWGYSESRQALIGDGRPERTFAYMPVMLNENYVDKNVALNIEPFTGGWRGHLHGIAITTACRDPERAFEFLDWMASEEAQILINWGIEGVNYNVIDGVRVVPEAERQASLSDPNYGARTGVGVYQHPFPQFGRGYIDSTGNWITRESPEIIREQYLDVERETLAAYGAEMWTDLYPPSENIPVPRHGRAWQYTLPPDLNAKVQEADDYMKTALANAVLGGPANFDAAWERIQRDLRAMGIEDANNAMTQQVQERVWLWESQ